MAQLLLVAIVELRTWGVTLPRLVQAVSTGDGEPKIQPNAGVNVCTLPTPAATSTKTYWPSAVLQRGAEVAMLSAEFPQRRWYRLGRATDTPEVPPAARPVHVPPREDRRTRAHNLPALYCYTNILLLHLLVLTLLLHPPSHTHDGMLCVTEKLLPTHRNVQVLLCVRLPCVAAPGTPFCSLISNCVYTDEPHTPKSMHLGTRFFAYIAWYVLDTRRDCCACRLR